MCHSMVKCSWPSLVPGFQVRCTSSMILGEAVGDVFGHEGVEVRQRQLILSHQLHVLFQDASLMKPNIGAS